MLMMRSFSLLHTYTQSLYSVKDLKKFHEEHGPNVSPAENFKKSYEDSKDILEV